MFGRGGPFGPGGPFGRGGPNGDGPFDPDGKRFFGRGDLKFALLELLSKRPMHGYEMMKTLQEQSGGRYNASPGSVYPTLQMLEDRGFVTGDTADGKKVYTITDDGKKFLAEERPRVGEGGHGRHRRHDPHMQEVVALMQELHACGPLLMEAFNQARTDPTRRERLRAIIERLRDELADLAAPGSNV